MVSPDSSKKKVANLRVQDLKLELEKRGLDHKGVKAVLLERLQKALIENGEDPNEIVVESPATPKGAAAKKTPARKRTPKGKAGDEEGESDYEGEDGMEGLGEDGMVVDEVTDETEASQEDVAQKATEDIDLDVILGSHEEDDDDVLNISLEEDQLFEEEAEGFTTDGEKASSNQEDKMETEESSAPEVEESKDTDGGESLALDTSLETKGEGSESLVVHVDEPFMSELDEELAETTTPKKSDDTQGDASTDQLDDNQLAETKLETQKEKGESESPEKSNKDDDSPVVEAKKEEKGDEKVTPAKSSSAGKDSNAADKRGTSSAGAANSRSKSSSSSGRSPTSKDDKERRGSGSSRPGSATTSGRNLWVSNLSRNTRAADLKASFSKYGKVVGAKVVTNARGPRAFCYGFVSMSSSSEAAKAINHLHRTELHGRTIHVERARSNMIPVASTSGASGRKKEPSPERKDTKDKADKKPTDKAEVKDAKSTGEAAKKDDKPASGAAAAASTTSESKDEKTAAASEKKDGEAAKVEAKEESKEEKTPADAPKQTAANTDKPAETASPAKTDAAEKKEGDDKRPSSSRSSTVDKDKPESKDGKARKDVLSLEKIKEQRLRERQRKRERDMREMERRRERERQDALRREREIIRRRQREEEEKLRREREQLRLAQQQERLERQSIEWERMKLHQERENLQRELEQHRQVEMQLRLAAERQATLKRSLDTRNMAPREVDPYIGDQKRRQPNPTQGRADFGNNNQNRAGVAIGTNVNPPRQPDRFSRRDTRQTDGGPRRDNGPTNKFSGPPNRPRDDARRTDQGRRDEPRRDDVRQRPQNRNDQAQRSGPAQRPGPPQRRDDPPPQTRQQPQQQRRDDVQRRAPDNFRRDDGIKRPDRRMDTTQRQPARNEPRRDSREGNIRDDRRGQQPNQGDRYQGGQGQSRGGNVPSYGGRDSSHRDRDDRGDRSRDSSHQAQPRMGGSHGGDNWKGARDSGVSAPSGRSTGSHSDWKSNQRGGDRTYDRDNRSQNYDRGQGNSWGTGDGRSGARDDQMMRGSEQHSHRGSLLGTPPIQDSTWGQSSSMDAPMHRGSSTMVMPGTSHISTLMNQSQPISSLLSSPSMSSPFISGGSVSGGLGGGVGMMQQVPLGGGTGSSYMGNQIGVGSSGGSGSSMDRHRSSQSDGRFAMRRY